MNVLLKKVALSSSFLSFMQYSIQLIAKSFMQIFLKPVRVSKEAREKERERERERERGREEKEVID